MGAHQVAGEVVEPDGPLLADGRVLEGENGEDLGARTLRRFGSAQPGSGAMGAHGAMAAGVTRGNGGGCNTGQWWRV